MDEIRMPSSVYQETLGRERPFALHEMAAPESTMNHTFDGGSSTQDGASRPFTTRRPEKLKKKSLLIL